MLNRKFFFALFIFLPLILRSDSGLKDSQRLLAEADRLAMLYNRTAAARLYARAESLFTQAGDRPNVLAAKIGLLWTTADAAVSLTAVEQIREYLRDPIVQSTPKLAIRALVAEAALRQNENEVSAREPWEEILNLASTVGDKNWEERAKAEIGQILYMDGNVQSAIGMIRGALISQYARFDLGAAVHYTAMVGNGAVEAGRPETGLEYCNFALRTASFTRDIGFPFLAYQGKARALIALHRSGEAEGLLNEAMLKAREVHNNLALAQLLIVAGTAAASADHASAVEQLKEAVQASQTNGFNHVFAWSTYELAKLYRDAGSLEKTESLSSKAIQTMRRLEDRFHLPEHLALLADVEARRGEFVRADQLYTEATDLIDALLVNVTSQQLKSSLIATLSDAYIGHFQLAATQFPDVARAFNIIEKARGRSLADTLRGNSESMSSADEVTIQAQKDINSIQLAILHETDEEARQSLFDQLFAAEQLLKRDRKVGGLYAGLGDTLKPVSLAAVRQSLHGDEILLEYVLSEPRSYCLEIRPSGARVIVLPAGRKHIEELVEDYLQNVRARREDVPSSTELFSALLEPAIADRPDNKVIIVRDGKLNLLPFDALKDQHGRYVVQSYVVTYAPSASVLQLLRRSDSRRQAPFNFLGVGDVVYSGPAVVSPRGVVGHEWDTGKNFSNLKAAALPNLAGTRDEVIDSADIIGGPRLLLLEKNATEPAFKALPLGDFRIIHLAVHGIADTAFPDRAALVFGTSPNSQDDGLLQAREITELPINAELVTLTACDTGTGKLLGQEGVANLETAFLLAGAKAVIASLWTTDDVYTTNLVKRLYEHLVSGQQKEQHCGKQS